MPCKHLGTTPTRSHACQTVHSCWASTSLPADCCLVSLPNTNHTWQAVLPAHQTSTLSRLRIDLHTPIPPRLVDDSPSGASNLRPSSSLLRTCHLCLAHSTIDPSRCPPDR